MSTRKIQMDRFLEKQADQWAIGVTPLAGQKDWFGWQLHHPKVARMFNVMSLTLAIGMSRSEAEADNWQEILTVRLQSAVHDFMHKYGVIYMKPQQVGMNDLLNSPLVEGAPS